MNYECIKYADIEKAKYPNLLAEIKESGYSICTVAEHMGNGWREQDDKEIWDKLLGREELLASEALGLTKLFNCKYDYIFAKDLEMIESYPLAKIRFFEENQKKRKEIEKIKRMEVIRKKVESSESLLDTVYQMCINATEGRMEGYV